MLARQIGWQHVDLDKLITEATGVTIPEIFAAWASPNSAKSSTNNFKRTMAKLLKLQKPRIVSLGGGTTSQPHNLDAVARERSRAGLAALPRR